MDTGNLPDENSYRFVAVLNKKHESGKLMNALGHMTAGLAGTEGDAGKMHLLTYRDKDGGIHPGISHFPYIVLGADNSNKIRTVRSEAIKRGISYTDFTDTMTLGTTEEQMKATENKKEEELEYLGICMFGETEVLKQFTGKFSLFR